MNLQGQWIYILISVAAGIVTVSSQFAWYMLLMIVLYTLYLFYMRPVRSFVICISGFLLAVVYMQYIEKENTPSVPLSSFYGVIETSPLVDGDRLSFIVTTENASFRLVYKLQTYREQQKWNKQMPGLTCFFTGTSEIPSPSRNPGLFDYREYLRKQQIHYLFRASTISSCTSNPSFTHRLFSIRKTAITYVNTHLPEQAAAFTNALVYGDRYGLDEETERAYQELGLVHLLAISGSHISLLIGIGGYILLRLGVTKEITAVVFVVIVPLYMFLAGASPSVIRASLMGICALVALLFALRISGLDILSIAVLLMLLHNPYVLYDIGFQYSVFSTAVLLLSSRTILMGGWWQAYLNMSIVAQLAAIPVTLHYFGQISPYSLVLNLVYVPYLSFIILPLCLITLFLSVALPSLAQLTAQLLTYLLDISSLLLAVCEKLPFRQLTFGASPMYVTILYVVCITAIFIAWEGRVWRKWLVHCIFMLVLLCSLHYVSPFFRGHGTVTFLDVGQGDCIIIQLPYSKATYVIDTGGNISLPKESWQIRKREYSIGTDVLLPYLRSQGIRRIDKLILTHGDQDHIGAAKDILKAVSVKEVIVGKKRLYGELEEESKRLALKKGIAVRTVTAGDTWKSGAYQFTILAPAHEARNENDYSIVLYTEMGGKRWLFTGDLEANGEESLVKRYGSIPADILKVGHHGSKTSTTDTLIRAVQPTTAIISAGVQNRYGHPHQEVLQRLKENKISIWRTDQHGAIIFTFTAEGGTFQRNITYDDI